MSKNGEAEANESRDVYDFNTKNKSFIQMHEYLKNEGINNNKFMLYTKNPRLKGLSYKELTSTNNLISTINECKHNIWFFFRELYTLPCPSGVRKPFELNLNTMSYIFLKEKGYNTYLISSRQTGKNVLMNGMNIYHQICNTGTVSYYAHACKAAIEMSDISRKNNISRYAKLIRNNDSVNIDIHSLLDITILDAQNYSVSKYIRFPFIEKETVEYDEMHKSLRGYNNMRNMVYDTKTKPNIILPTISLFSALPLYKVNPLGYELYRCNYKWNIHDFDKSDISDLIISILFSSSQVYGSDYIDMQMNTLNSTTQETIQREITNKWTDGYIPDPRTTTRGY